MTEAVGWIGGVCFALCAVPQARISWLQGHSNGLSFAMLLMWFVGEVLTAIYVIQKSNFEQAPLLFNYLINFLCLLIIIRYKVWPKETSL